MIVLIEFKHYRFAMDKGYFNCTLSVYVTTSEELFYPLERPEFAEAFVGFEFVLGYC
jgi:hypothetical protein